MDVFPEHRWSEAMRGQIGGVSFGKRPMLTLKPDYVLKPLHHDHRGFREIAFYEAIQLASKQGSLKANSSAALAAAASWTGVRGGIGTKNFSSSFGHGAQSVLNGYDALAMLVAVFMQDAVVIESEHTVIYSWRCMRREIELLRRLSTFIAPYYGVMGQQSLVSNPIESLTSAPASRSIISNRAHLLLSDATANFSRPCAIDLKMGQQSYEPDAPLDKCEREIRKYQHQKEFGFRIVGMRIYDPGHPECDGYGFRRFDKFFGRSLGSREEVKNALRTFVSIAPGLVSQASADDILSNGYSNRTVSPSSAAEVCPKVRTRVITNFLAQLRVISGWFQENTAIAFFSSSILMVYEGDLSVGSNRDVTNLKMIDFSHVRRQAGGDSGYLYGLKTVISLFQEILHEAQQWDQ
eukprot:CAMPEP_0183321280 /NCGR_PEP_ID=MMETSP0160_2-20130417/68477_1 /TAXON_ID=2839 ORGANISM="Odontella Sinensis, Strain Grunow 1884" /NCGR_SAMPLE_ID=MMETSP0160_2 /ASSEMBLY_ACC=CAM_ASM_000250 /LENGTH=407 /DNA_ID=CAMNT_0025488183 /DNA_START=291 /DNA_END=1515 /DNA_ORIENTATION=+